MATNSNAAPETEDALLPTTAGLERFVRNCDEEGLTEAETIEKLQELFDRATTRLADAMAGDQEAVLKARRDEDEAFEGRLWDRWGHALDVYYATFVACQEAGRYFNERHRPAAADENDVRFEALSRIHARACAVASAIYVLLRTGHAPDAHARWRTLHELAVVARVLGDNDPGLSERYLDHEAVDSYNDAQVYQARCEGLGYEPITDEEMAEIARAYEAAVEKYGDPFRRRWGWAEPVFTAAGKRRFEIETLEQIAGIDNLRPVVKWAHHRTHADAKGASSHLVDPGAGDQMLLAGPSSGGLADPGHGALISLAQVTTTYILRGREQMDPWAIPVIRVVDQMVARAGLAFLDIHEQLEADEEER